jgi:uncharacterized protein YbjT (DUF2867 family)
VKVTVTAPTGNIGNALVEELLSAGVEVTLIARSPEKVKDYAERGARVVRGALEDPGVVEKAVETAGALFWLTPTHLTSTDLRGWQNSLGKVAAGVARSRPEMHVVNLSSVGAHLSEGTGPINGLRDVEKQLNEATRRVTHLRPTYFMENVLSSLPTIAEHNAIFSTVPAETVMNQVATADIAAAAAEVILGPKPEEPQAIHIMGPEELTYANVAAIVSETLGKKVQHVTVPAEQLRRALQNMGASDDVAGLFVEMEAAFRKRLTVPPPGSKIRRGTTTFREFARKQLAAAYDGAAGETASGMPLTMAGSAARAEMR